MVTTHFPIDTYFISRFTEILFQTYEGVNTPIPFKTYYQLPGKATEECCAQAAMDK
jgi:hypothetical protein